MREKSAGGSARGCVSQRKTQVFCSRCWEAFGCFKQESNMIMLNGKEIK